MKTIEERATEYACDDGVMPDSHECESCFNIYGKCTRDAYIAGAKSEREELTRWHDPKEPPQDQKHKLIKLDDCGYTLFTTGQWCPDSKRWWGAEIDENSKVIGWREIHG